MEREVKRIYIRAVVIRSNYRASERHTYRPRPATTYRGSKYFSVSVESPAIETNEAGEFTFEEVSPGKYMLISGTKSPERDNKGKIVPAFNAFIPPMKDDKDEVIIIEVVAGEVIDLGQVLTASSNFP